MNIGIQSAKGQIVMRMDAHTVYPPNYISGLVDGSLGVMLITWAEFVLPGPPIKLPKHTRLPSLFLIHGAWGMRTLGLEPPSPNGSILSPTAAIENRYSTRLGYSMKISFGIRISSSTLD
jgi:hypothetical protein